MRELVIVDGNLRHKDLVGSRVHDFYYNMLSNEVTLNRIEDAEPVEEPDLEYEIKRYLEVSSSKMDYVKSVMNPTLEKGNNVICTGFISNIVRPLTTQQQDKHIESIKAVEETILSHINYNRLLHIDLTDQRDYVNDLTESIMDSVVLKPNDIDKLSMSVLQEIGIRGLYNRDSHPGLEHPTSKDSED